MLRAMFVFYPSKLCGGRCVPTQEGKDLNLSYVFYTLWENEVPYQHKSVPNHKPGPADEPFLVCMVPVYFRFYQCYTDEKIRDVMCVRERDGECKKKVLFSVLYLPILLP